MILEIANLDVKADAYEAFEAAVNAARPLFARAKGYIDLEFRKSVETPGRYVLLIQWETLEDHTITFRQSEDCAEWRRMVSAHLASPPSVDHSALIASL